MNSGNLRFADVKRFCSVRDRAFFFYPFQVELNPRPWHSKWHRYNYKGIHPNSWQYVTEKMWKKAEKAAKPWEKYDLMKEFRWVCYPCKTQWFRRKM